MDVMKKDAVATMWNGYATAELATAEVGLFKGDLVLTPNMVLADFVVPTGTWYAPEPVAYGEPYAVSDDALQVTAGSVQFNYTGASPAETVHGWFVVKPGAPDVLIAYGKLPEPKTMGTLLDSVVVRPEIKIPAIGV